MGWTKPYAGKMSVKVLIGLLGVLVLIAGGGATYVLLGKSGATVGEKTEGQPPDSQEQAEMKSSVPDDVHVVSLGEFLVNVNSAAGMRYLRTEVALELVPLKGSKSSTKKADKHGEKSEEYELPNEALLRAKDAVVRELTASEFDKLRTEEGRAELKQRLCSTLNEVLSTYKVQQVLLVSFVMATQ